MFFYKHILAAIVLGLISANSLADDLFDVLKRMSDADKNQSYHGTFILRKSDNLSALRVAHGTDDQGIWERVDSLNGEEKKVLRYNNRIVSVYPDRQLVTVRHTNKQQSLHLQLPENIDQLTSYYTMNRLDDDRIASHESLVVDLIPRDQYRYGYRYWIDKETGVLLRCDMVSEKNEIVEQMMFTSLEYLSGEASHGFDLQQFEFFNQQVTDEPEVELLSNTKTQWTVRRLPDGFSLTQNTMRYSRPLAMSTSQGDEPAVENAPPDLQHMVYSDGIASVSVFIEKNKGNDKHLLGASSMGAVSAFGRPLDDFYVTVVGEVPGETVQLMAQSAVKMP